MANGNGYEIDGRTYPRVTTILNTLAKPGLERWRQKLGIEEAERVSRAAADLGTRIHAGCEAINRGGDPPHDTDLQPYLAAYAFWFERNVVEVVACELTVWHEAYAYAGQVDLVAKLTTGRTKVIDLKSGKSVSGETRLQTAAYALALADRGIPTDGRMVVRLPSDQPGVLLTLEYDNDEVDRKAWIALLRVHRFQERHKHDWRLVPGVVG